MPPRFAQPVPSPTPTPAAAPRGDYAGATENMGRISGWLWILAALVGFVCTFLPGASHADIWILTTLAAAVLAYGIASVTGLIPWQRASLTALAVGMAVTVPVVGLAVYLTGGSLSYIEPLLVCSLLYAAFFFPPRWAWPLSIELVLVAGAPLLLDPDAIENAFLPRYLALASGFLAVTAVLVRLKARLLAAEAYQREIANRDPLTGVGNRRAFDAAVAEELSRPRRRDGAPEPFSLLLIDLDDFKGVNDRYGHPAGDAMLRVVARQVLGVLRPGATLARIGGDEFVVIAPGTDCEGAERMAEAIRTAVVLGGSGAGVPPARASVGWSVFPDDGEEAGALLGRADERMLRQKLGTPSRQHQLRLPAGVR